jgi:hypothetical protein
VRDPETCDDIVPKLKALGDMIEDGIIPTDMMDV